MMEDVIELSPSPEPEPGTTYRPLRRKRVLSESGNESVIELTDSSDSQCSTPVKRAKRRKETVEPSPGPSTSKVPVDQSRVLRRTHKSRGQTPASRQTSAVSRRHASPVQKPHSHSMSVISQEPGMTQAKPLTPPATPDSPQQPNHQLTSLAEHVALTDEPPRPVTPVVSEVAPESHDKLVECVREVVPDVLPAHVFELLAKYENTFPNNLLDAVIHILLEDRSYPKDVKGKAKAKAAEKTAETSGDVVDYSRVGGDRRLGQTYRTLSSIFVHSNFPDLDQTFVHEALKSHEGHCAPTYLYLLRNGATPASVVPVAPKLGKRGGKVGSKSYRDQEEFVKEHSWLVQTLENERNATVSESILHDVEEEGEGIECGCCFSSYPFSKMAQCTETHLFCTDCVTSYASQKLGEQNADLHCMDLSGCKVAFPDSELRRVLPDKLFELLEHIRQRRDIELAELKGLEECPFCDYKVIMDADFQADKVLRCQNEECGMVSCRKCRKEDHLPKSCEEMEEDRKLDGKHAIEEAMTRALMRNCPQCQKGFVKEYGCNKMTCTYCHTVSCYVCRSIITGYEHFDHSRPGGPRRTGKGSSSKCPLWDSAEDRHSKEVAAAADKALKEYKTLHPDVQDKDIRVELPPAPPPPPGMGMQNFPGRALQNGFPPPLEYVQVHHARNVHVPIAHPVVAFPFPALPPPAPAPEFNHEQLFAHHGLEGFRQPGERPLPGPGDPAAMYPMPQYNPHPVRVFLPYPIPPLPRPPIQPMLPPMQVATLPGSRRPGDRGRRRGKV